MSNVYFANTKAEICSVAQPGSSLFPSIAAAIVSNLFTGKFLNETKASILLKEYLKHFPKEQSPFNRLSAIEQWKSMIRPSGGPVKVSSKLAAVLQKIVYDHFKSEPARYCHAIDGISNFEERMQFEPEKVTRMMVFSLVADFLEIGINFYEVDGQCTIPAIFRFHKEAESKINITYDRANGEFRPLLDHPERFKNMRQTAPVSIDNASVIDIKFFQEYLNNLMKESVRRYATMYTAGEEKKSELIEKFTSSGSYKPALARNTGIESDSYTKELPVEVKMLIHSLAWGEAVYADNYKSSLDSFPSTQSTGIAAPSA